VKEFSVNYIIGKIFAPLIRKVSELDIRLHRIEAELELTRMAIVQNRIREFHQIPQLENLMDAEFQVFSQWGEDGIIQYLISRIQIPNKIFIEFGVDDYRECNTRFLLMNNNWSGLAMDGDAPNIERIRSMPFYWRHDLNAKCAFITAENINSLIQETGIHGDIGLLSIDIDGNDYWVLKAISERIISPRILIVEYNSVFGKEHAITIPYSADFQRTKAHFSNLYFGASLKAFCQLAEVKGYKFVGSNSAGTNAFFVRSDIIGNLSVTDYQNGYVESKLREGRDETGKLTYLAGTNRIALIGHLPVIDLESNKTVIFETITTKINGPKEK
jgi:hypothetical protein